MGEGTDNVVDQTSECERIKEKRLETTITS